MCPSFLPLYYKLFSISEQWWAHQQKVPNEQHENLSSNIFSLKILEEPRLEESIIQSPFGLRVRFKNFRSFSAESSRDEDCVFQHQQRVGWYQPFHNLGTPLLSVYYSALLQKSPCTFAPLMTHGYAAWTIIDNPPRLCVFMWSIFLLSLNFL